MSNETQPKVYLHLDDEDARDISISSFSEDHPEYENNHIFVREANSRKTPGSTSMNILRNVLVKSGINVVLE